jgi:DnaJ homolog subfamily A member 2
MPSQRHHEPGDLYVRFVVNFPASIDPSVIPLLERCLPLRKPLDEFSKNTLVEEVSLDAADPRSRDRSHSMDGEPMDEDGDGEPRVQCANQ